MPRCCNNAKCGCVIIAGAGARVTGSGTPLNPVVIELEGGSVDTGGGGWSSGDLKWTARSTAPAGWLVADGAAVNRSTYSGLFAAIGTTYGPGDGSTTFNVPDLTGRFMLGADGLHPRGSQGGVENTTLTTANLPAHTHSIDHTHAAHTHSINHDHPSFTIASSGSHQHSALWNATQGGDVGTYNSGAITGRANDNGALINGELSAHTHPVDIPAFTGTSGSAAAAAFTGSSGSAGSGTAFTNMPPYTAALPLIKT